VARNELHRKIVDAALLAHGVDRDDIRVVQLRGRLRFGAEAGDLPFIEHRREREHLQGDLPIERELPRLVHDAHAAAADLADDFVIAQALGPGQRTGRGRFVRRRQRFGPQPGGHLVEDLQAVDVRSQFVGEIRMFAAQLLQIGRQPGDLQLAHVAIEHQREPLVAVASSRPDGGDVLIDAFGHLNPRASSRSRSNFTARSHNIRTAPEDRSMRRPISSKGIASICRSTSTSR
jgi:hypothetical protein